MDVSPSKNDTHGHFKELKKSIATLTHTGEKVLDPPVLKSITMICKISNDYVIHAYHLLMEHLEAKHAEVRLSSFQICIELFKRSHCFRELLVANLQQVMVLTAETNPSKPMPAPRSVALSLKKLALTTIRDWAKEFGAGYKRLRLAISYLKNCKKVDLNAMAQEEAAERSRQAEINRRKKALQNERFKKVQNEIKDKQSDIISSLTEMENCISLLLPRPEDFFIEDDSIQIPSTSSKEKTKTKSCALNERNSQKEIENDELSDDVEENLSSKEPIFDFRKYGIINPNFSLTLKVDLGKEPLVKKTEENASIFENAQELHKVVSNRYQSYIDKWVAILEKCTELDSSTVNEVLKKVKDLKFRLDAVLDKYEQLNIGAPSQKMHKNDDSDTSDSDFEEVQNKVGFEAFSKSAPVQPSVEINPVPGIPGGSSSTKSCNRDWTLFSEENHEKDPTSIFSTLSTISSKSSPVKKHVDSSKTETVGRSFTRNCKSSPIKEKSSKNVLNCDEKPGPSDEDSRKAKLLSVAPKLPFDIDLYHWEDEKIEAPTRLTVKPDGHRFWVASAEDRDEIRDPDGEASLRRRVIEFTGDFQRVQWTCRAPLASGKLCPRQDRVKCPFHGKVIARDENGKPSHREDQLAEEKRLELENANKVPDWQDPKLLAELKETTGVDLRMPDKSKRGWRKNLPGEEKKYAGLTDIKAIHNTTYSRLAKKVFQKSAMRRVGADMDKLDRKRFRDKYGDQFNYVFDH